MSIPFPDLKGLTFGLKAFVVFHTLALMTYVVVRGIEPPWWLIAAYLGALTAAGVEAVKDFMKPEVANG